MMMAEVLRESLEANLPLPAILARAAQKPEAMVFLESDGTSRTLPYAELLERSQKLASCLVQRGLGRGEAVILFFEDERTLVLSLWAVLLAGGVAVPLSAPASYSDNDEALRKIIAVYRKCAERIGKAPVVLSDVESGALAAVASWREAIPSDCFVDASQLAEGAHAALPADAPPEADDLAILMFSSGSTGDPKGVRLTHRQILVNLVQLCERSELTEEDRSLSWLPLTHDMGLVLFHVCHTLAGIAQYKMTPMAFARNPAQLFDYAGAYRISVLGMPNFGYDQLYRAAEGAEAGRWSLESIRLIYNGAEPIDPKLCRRFAERFAAFGLRRHVINPGWGIAEASVAASGFPHGWLPRWENVPSLWVSTLEGMPVGRPIRTCAPEADGGIEIVGLGPAMTGMQLRVLDDNGRELPPAYLGHIEIHGANVTSGYFDDADVTWCKTGDIGFIYDGLVYLTGRAKDVLFLNGRNHFSNDIESALCQKLGWPANQLAVVGVTHPTRRVEQVVLFFRQTRGADRDAQAETMRRALEALLAYPVAGAVGVPALPKTTSGKIRRFALRQALVNGEYEAALAESASRTSRALTAAEAAIGDIAREILPDHGTQIDPEAHLSRYGLDSVGFLQLAFRLSAKLGRQVAPQALIRAGSLAQMAPVVDAAPDNDAAPSIVTGPRVPLTARQASLWTAWLLDPASIAYNETYWLKVEGALDEAKWIAAARQVVSAHPMLHAVVDDAGGLALALLGTREADVKREACDEADIESAMARLAAETFDLRRGPLLRLRLLATGAGHTVFLSAHHIVTDGWSLQGLMSQIFAAYSGGAAPEAESALWFEPSRFTPAQINAWRTLALDAEAIQLPGEAITLARGRTLKVTSTLSQATSQAVREWQLAHGSEFTALAGGLMTLLARLSGVQRPLLGTVVSGRHEERAQSRVGYFAMTVPLVAELGAPKTTFTSLVDELELLRMSMLGGEAPDLATLESQPGPSVAQAMRVVYVHQNTAPIRLSSGLVAKGHGQYRGPARIDLVVSSGWEDQRLVLQWEYDGLRFNAEQMAGYAELFEHVLAQLLAAPGRELAKVDLLSPAQRALWQPYQCPPVAVDFARDVVTRFEAMASALPELTAVSDAAIVHSYGALRERVDALCAALEDRGVTRGERIAVLTDRSADYVIALLACFKMAAIAIPLDPALPHERVEQILADSAASLLLVTPAAGLDEAWLADWRSLSFDGATLPTGVKHAGCARTPGDGAYLIFTSGSTGKPKGVLITHGCITNLVDWVTQSFGYQAGETMCQFAPFSFDVSMAEILPSLCAGLHLHVLANERRSSPDLYLETMRERQVHVATITPAYLAVLNEIPQRCEESLTNLRLLILGGEALKTEDVLRFRAHSPHVAIVNVYGPTEATVLCSAYPVPRELTRQRDVQPLGRSISNTEMWILDEAMRVCPATLTGTLYIGGQGLSQGYWQDAEKTNAAFHMLSPDGLAPRRFYCSGDLARLAKDGELEFVGRADTQIKLRGFRIELGEIESVLEQHPQVQQAVLAAVAREGAERVLVAYYSGETVARDRLDAHLRERLPAYMMPSAYVHVTEWPLSANRKVDRKRLPAPEWQAAGECGAEDVPRTDTERGLARIWSELLGIRGVSRTAHFAMLGGSSLNAAQLLNRVREHFGRELSLKEVMLAPTLEDMARRIDEASAPATAEPTRRRVNDDAPIAASEAQARMVFMDRAHPGSPLNNIPLTLALGKSGRALDPARLQSAVTALAQRHPMLRVRLTVEPQGVMQSFDSAEPEYEVQTGADKALAMELLRRFHCRPFALDKGPLWRVGLVRAADSGQEWLALSLHHAIADGVTLVRVLSELDALYQGTPLPSTETELSYSDYVAWQRELLDSPFGERAAQFWSEPSHQRRALKLPHTPKSDDVTGRQFAVDLDARQTAILKTICAEQQVSPFALMLSVFGFVLGQRCEAQQFALGVTLSGRSRRALESVPGLFVNTVPLAFDWAKKERFSALLQRVKSQVGELQDLQDFPLNRVMATQKLRETPFNVLFNEEMLPADLTFGGESAALEGVSTGIAKFPLLISFLFGHTWRFRMECRENVCPQAWVAGLLDDVKRLIRALDGMTEARLDDLETPDENLMALLA